MAPRDKKETPGTKKDQRVSKRSQKEATGSQKGAKREPKGAKREPNGIPKSMFGKDAKRELNISIRGASFGQFWEPKLIKFP